MTRQVKMQTNEENLQWRDWKHIVILCIANLLNYMDRFSLASILTQVQDQFQIKNNMAGLLQTTFMLTYLITAVFWGYLGDRYSRKLLLALGVLIWNCAHLGSSFPSDFWTFLAIRGVFGVGQACFCTIAPTMISDYFANDMRSRILACFYLAIPVGQGLGYVVGTLLGQWFKSWRWSLRLTPAVNFVLIVIIVVFIEDPTRAQSEDQKTHWLEDVKYLFKNNSFLYSTFGFTCIAFAGGALSWWGVKLVVQGTALIEDPQAQHVVTTIFGLVCVSSGAVGLISGYFLSYLLKNKYPRIDPIVCALGLFVSAPLLVGATFTLTYSFVWFCVVGFFGFILLNLNWAINVDILMCVVVPNRRSLAMGLQLFMGHALGDVGSPFLLGLMADGLIDVQVDALGATSEFRALQYACIMPLCVSFVGGVFFIFNAYYIVDDMRKAEMEASQKENV